MRQQGDIRDSKGRSDAPSAGELGWDDSLYATPRPPRQRTGSHDDTDDRGGDEAPPPRRKRGRRILRWTAVSLAVLVLLTAGAGYLYVQHLNDNLRTGDRSASDSGVAEPEPNVHGNTPLNILVLGSDSRNSAANLELGGSRSSVGKKPLADVQMLLHISADRSNASMISIPRDTRVDIPECTDAETGRTYPAVNGLINTTLTRGGPGCTLATWEELTGVYINHWVTVDFAGVVAMADAVGGVEVCVRHNVWDRALPGVPGGSGLKLTAGTHEIQGETALQWLRTRHAFHSDLGRAKAQHMYLNSMLRELKSQHVFADSGRLLDLAEAATKALTVSEEIGSVEDLAGIGMQFQSVPTDRVTMATMPTIQDPTNANHLLPDPDAEDLWAMLREDVALDPNGKQAGKKPGTDGGKKTGGGAPSSEPSASPAPSRPEARPASAIPVQVVNGTEGGGEGPVDGRATAVSEQLGSKGFTQAVAVAAVQPEDKTAITYPESGGEQARADALAVADALRIPAGQVTASAEVRVTTLVVGADWRSGTAYEAPGAGAVPDSADPLNASDRNTCMDVYEPYRW